MDSEGNSLDESVRVNYARQTGPNPYILTRVEGLGPVKTAISTAQKATYNGETFLSARSGGRNIVLDVELNPNYSSETVASLRSDLYRVLSPGEHVIVALFFSGPSTPLYTNGWVESVEPDIFSQIPTLRISLISIEPYFTRGTITESVNDPSQPLTIPYSETIPTGFEVSFRITGATPYVNIAKAGSYPPMRINDLQTGDRLTLNTSRGFRALTLTRGGVTGDALAKLQNKLNWHQLDRDDINRFTFTVGSENVTSLVYKYSPLVAGV